ncbi:AfsR/SARP family transcriptional regulator [Streptomyces sp. NPDC029526]|uniref:AfsR/SARP family transcriptional regulator n=1 Tax=Streptomyces sp. NPDC029526 TaxID=3155728 RepID=UPI0033E70AA9
MLGPMTVTLGGRSIVPTAGKPRQLLALLALRSGRVVQVPTFMKEIWGGNVPKSGLTTLQTYVLHLRRLIADALPDDAEQSPKGLLATRYNGYQLSVEADGTFDLVEFERLAASGASALGRGDAAAASRILGPALELWRGPALMDVPMGQVLGAEIVGMNEARIRAQEQHILADLWLGKHTMLIPRMSKLFAQHPLHENIAACLMIAYQRSGASWRALEVFRALRKSLAEELGVEPSARLQNLYRELLSNTSELSLREFVLT